MRPSMQGKQKQMAVIVLALLAGICWGWEGHCVTSETYYVDASYDGRETGSSNRPFDTIGEALEQTVAGRFDTVIVRSGSYAGPITVTVTTTLVSEEGVAHTFIENPAKRADPLVTLSNGAAIRGFTLGATANVGLSIAQDAAAEVSNCAFYQNGVAIQAESGSRLRCVNNTFYQNTVAVRADASAQIDPLRNCVLAENGTGVSVANGGSVVSGYTVFFKNTVTYEGSYVPGDTDFVSNPQFIDAANLNFHLLQVSNLRNTGDPSPEYRDTNGTRNDVGADGGPYGVMDRLAPNILVTTTPSPPQGFPPLAVFLDASASHDDWGVTTWEWDFDAMDGVGFADGNGAAVPVLLTEPGGYLVSVRATDNAGLSAVSMFNIRVGAPPQVLRMTPQPGAGPAPLTVAMNIEAVSLSGGALSYVWEFDGDAVIDSTDQNPVFTYPEDTAPGIQRAALLVMDEEQVSTQFLANITVTPYPITASVEITPGTGGELSVTDISDPLAETRVIIPGNAVNEKMTFGLSKVPDGVIPIMPEGNIAHLFDIAPTNIQLSQAITVETPIGSRAKDDDVEVWYWQADSHVWFEGGITHIRVSNGTLSFRTSYLGTFAIVGPNPGGPCFIATAAYGTPLAGEVQVLRNGRDTLLLSNPLGSALVEVYYRLSPPLADLVAVYPVLTVLARLALWPIVAVVRAPWLGAAILAGVMVVFFARRVMRRAWSE